jgi:type I restriction enzyme M protein
MTQCFHHCQPPRPVKELRADFWKPEKEAEKMLEMLAR